jgi:predicted RNA polymerase sigma factor
MTDVLERVFREQCGRVLAALIGFLGDFDLAEEAAQEAFAIAAGAGPGMGRRPTRAPETARYPSISSDKSIRKRWRPRPRCIG